MNKKQAFGDDFLFYFLLCNLAIVQTEHKIFKGDFTKIKKALFTQNNSGSLL